MSFYQICAAHWANRGRHHPGGVHYCNRPHGHEKRCKCACGQERK